MANRQLLSAAMGEDVLLARGVGGTVGCHGPWKFDYAEDTHSALCGAQLRS